ncbi:MAG: cobaltochelatase subunit CobN [Gemmatimonadota bacterium]
MHFLTGLEGIRRPRASRPAGLRLVVAALALSGCSSEGGTTLIIDSPSGVNRFVQAAHSVHEREVADDLPETRWIIRTTRQVVDAPVDTVRAWLEEADRAVIRLAYEEVAEKLTEAMPPVDARPGPLWFFSSEPSLLRETTGSDGQRHLADRDDDFFRRLADGVDSIGVAGPELKAWEHADLLLDAKGEEAATRLLDFLAAAEAEGESVALASSSLPESEALDELYALDGLPDFGDDAPVVGIIDFDSYALNSESVILDSIAAALSRHGIRPRPVIAEWGERTADAMMEHFAGGPTGEPEVDAVISLQTFLLGGAGGREAADSLLASWGVPVFRAIRMTDFSPLEWRLSAEGIPWASVYHQVALPELQAVIEPTVVAAESTDELDELTGARRALYAPIPEQVEMLAERTARWVNLRRTENEDRRVAFIYYNHPPGRQNIGADNLNVIGSSVRILELLRDNGYDLGDWSEERWPWEPDSLAAQLVRRGVNAGMYGAGMLDSLVASGAVLVPAEQYETWFRALPELVQVEIEDGPLGYLQAILEEYIVSGAHANRSEETERIVHEIIEGEIDLVFAQMESFFDAFSPFAPEMRTGPDVLAEVEREARQVLDEGAPLNGLLEAKRRFLDLGIEALSGWGPPPGNVMRVTRAGQDYLVVPGVQGGNVFLGPQPERGFAADPEKVHSSTLVAPPHQYLAVYAYLSHEFGADAVVHVGRHSSYEWLPRKQVGLSAWDHPVAVLQGMPSIYLYTVDGVGEGLQAKRRGLAALIDHLTPPIKTTELYGDLLALHQLHDGYYAQEAPERRSAIVEEILEILGRPELADLREEMEAENGGLPVTQMGPDLLVHEVGHETGAFRETMMPFGLHTFARRWSEEEANMLAESMAGFQVSADAPNRAQGLAEATAANVAAIHASTEAEGESLLRALAGERVEPGSGNDPIRTPSVLPTGRNFHALDATLVPTSLAMRLGNAMADQSLERLRRENDDPNHTPERVSAVLWAVETTRDEGATVGFVLQLLGLRAVWDVRGKVERLERIPLRELGRPRVDVTMITSGLFRDIFSPVLHLLDQGTRLAIAGSARTILTEQPGLAPALRAALFDIPAESWGTESLAENHVAGHWLAEVSERLDEVTASGATVRDAQRERAGRVAQARIFGPSVGDYGAGLNYLIGQPWTWDDRGELSGHYLRNMQYAYGGEVWGDPMAADGLERKLEGTEAAFHSRSSNLYGVADNDDFFDYFGGLSMAVEAVTGTAPKSFILQSTDPNNVSVERLQTFLGRELRARYYNPEWIEGQMDEGYDGARTISNKFVEFLWGWQVTNPDIVRDWMWTEIQDVYVEDRYGLGLEEWFDAGDRGYALQNVLAILMTAAERGFWGATEEELAQIADRLGTLVNEIGVACSTHLCGNTDVMEYAEARMTPELQDSFREALDEARFAWADTDGPVDETADGDVTDPSAGEPSAVVTEVTPTPEESAPTNTPRNVALGLLLALLLAAFGTGVLRGRGHR